MTERRSRPHEDGRVARGASTRANLLEAGVRIFAARSFSEVTTRELADAAGANQAAILYHFGSKEGLYLAVAEHVAERARAALQGAIAPTAGSVASGGEPTPIDALRDVLRALTRGLIAMAADGALADFIVREQAQPGPAFDILYRGYIGDMHARVTALVAAATDRAADDRSAIIDAHAIIGMALSFAVARATLLRRLRSRRYTATEAEALAERVAELGCRSLGVGASPKATAHAPTRISRR